MRIEGNRIFFGSDDEFYNWAVTPTLQIKQSKSGHYYSDFDFSTKYKQAVEDGKLFVIEDEDSVIFKRKCVSVATETKYVSNLIEYYES